MKHLRLFEGKDGKDELLDAYIEFERICNLIRDFINFERLHHKKVKGVYYYYFEKDVEVVGDRVLFAMFGDLDKDSDDDQPGVMLNREQQKQLYRFIENPTLYKSERKYNL